MYSTKLFNSNKKFKKEYAYYLNEYEISLQLFYRNLDDNFIFDFNGIRGG